MKPPNSKTSATMSVDENVLLVREMGHVEYQATVDAMRLFTDSRDDRTPDECWFLQHSAVYTLGQAADLEHLHNPGEIPVVKIDRGGEVTFHAPGQLVAYLLVDIRRRNMYLRDFVVSIEQAIIETLAEYEIAATGRRDAPGVYLPKVGRSDSEMAKIASLGLKIRRGCSYHGLALNVNMDMQPWQRINPCGLGVDMTQLADHCTLAPSIAQVSQTLAEKLVATIGYNAALFQSAQN